MATRLEVRCSHHDLLHATKKLKKTERGDLAGIVPQDGIRVLETFPNSTLDVIGFLREWEGRIQGFGGRFLVFLSQQYPSMPALSDSNRGGLDLWAGGRGHLGCELS